MRASLNELVTSTRSLAVGDDVFGALVSDVPSSGGESESKSDEQEHEKQEFINIGLKKWEESRQRWRSPPESSSSSSSTTSVPMSDPGNGQTQERKRTKRHAKDIDVDEVIDLIVSNRWRQQAPPTSRSVSASITSSSSEKDDACFPNPVTLPQMVDILIDLWEAEGLDI